MPIYLYKNPKTDEIIEVYQGMNDEHVYSEGGVNFDRVLTVPQASIDSQIDPNNPHQFAEKVGKSKGTYGDLLDRSKELSQKRADKIGAEDPIRRAHFDKYSKERKGRKHPEDR